MDENPVVIAGSTGVILFWSEGAVKAFGHSADDAVGQTLDLIVPPEYREAHWKGFRRAVETGEAGVENQVTPFPVQRADGEIAPAPGRLMLLRQPQGKVIGAMVVFA